MEVNSLSSLLLRARRAVALNFPVPVWVKAELSQVNERRGHYYLELLEKGDTPTPLAKVSGVVWKRTYDQVLRKRGKDSADVLRVGQEVCLQVEVDFHEVYGFKLQVVDWDPAFTLGQLELQRRAIIDELAAAGLLRKNASLSLKPVVQRLAVLSSAAAAGYADFVEQLTANPYGYRYDITLLDVSVQGAAVEPTVVEALERVNARPEQFDAILLLRGGGAKLDLASFDRAAIGEAIAASQLPVLVGIGHETDQTLPDLVAHSSLKTPTALAEFLIDRAATFEAQLLQHGRSIARLGLEVTHTKKSQLERARAEVATAARHHLIRRSDQQQVFAEAVLRAAKQALQTHRLQLAHRSTQFDGLDPAHLQQRGYVLVAKAGQRIHRAAEVAAGDTLTTYFADGSVESRVL